MKKEIKRKLLVSVISIFNIGFLMIITNSNDFAGHETSYHQVVVDSIAVCLSLSLVYVAPLILLVGFPISLLIDFALKKQKHKTFLSFALHISAGITSTYLIVSLFSMSPRMEDLLNPEIFLKWCFILIYPSLFFWSLDNLVKRPKK